MARGAALADRWFPRSSGPGGAAYPRAVASDPVDQVRRRALALPEAEERPFGGHTSPAFRVRDKMFCVVSEDRSSLTVKAGPGVQGILVGDDPGRFFVPRYVGSKGWVGVHLDGDVDWDEVGGLIEDSYCLIAPRALARQVSADLG